MTMNDEARAYFTDMGLTYADVRREDVEMLRSMLDVELRKVRYLRPITGDPGQLVWRVRGMYYKCHASGGMCHASVTLCWLDDSVREGINFNQDGFIGFCGWASTSNTLPVIEAFKDWCDLMAMRKQALEVESGEVGA